MERLWSWEHPATVRDVLDDLNADPGRDRRLAYTTVLTVMDNLFRKDILSRELVGRAHRYTPSRSREEHAADLIATLLSDADDRTAPLLRFVERLTPAEVNRLRKALDEAATSQRPPGSRREARRTGGQ
jgi:predicted transcriptional regulator